MSVAMQEVREGDYLLQVRRLGDSRVEWALVRRMSEDANGTPTDGTVVISGEAVSEQDALRRGRLQLMALGLAR